MIIEIIIKSSDMTEAVEKANEFIDDGYKITKLESIESAVIELEKVDNEDNIDEDNERVIK